MIKLCLNMAREIPTPDTPELVENYYQALMFYHFEDANKGMPELDIPKFNIRGVPIARANVFPGTKKHYYSFLFETCHGLKETRFYADGRVSLKCKID